MKVIAKAEGYLGKDPVEVDRAGRKSKEVFILPGDKFEWDKPLASWMIPEQSEVVKEEPTAELSKKEIMAKLRESGIKFSNAAPIETLKALLPE